MQINSVNSCIMIAMIELISRDEIFNFKIES